MEIGMNTYGKTFWKLATDENTFALTLVDGVDEYFLDSKLTDEFKTLGQACRDALHDRLDEFINRNIQNSYDSKKDY